MQRSWLAASVMMGVLAFSSAHAEKQVTDAVAPEESKGWHKNELVKAKDFMVSSAHPAATQAGYDVLKAGGSAADAAVAVQLMLGLVEPQSSGLGGGAFMVYWDAKAQKLVALDGRETAPKAMEANSFQDAEGKPLKFMTAVVGGKSVGTPGTLKLLEEAHKRYGKTAWAELFTAPIQTAKAGFIVTPHMAEKVAKAAETLEKFEPTKSYFFTEEGKSLPAGFLRTNPAYAKTLEAIASEGTAPFYKGDIAKSIVETVQNAPLNPGKLSLEDLANYEVKERSVVCTEYRAHDVCGMGPPTSGGITVGQILGVLNHFDLNKLGKDDPESWRLIGDASRLAFADRGRYIGDSDFVDVPTDAMLAKDYLVTRAELLKGGKRLEEVAPGNPLSKVSANFADDESIELPSTSHFVIRDKEGNIVSMTTTIENGFGSRLMTNGFLLNNEMTDFSFVAEKDGKPVANRIEPGKRPRSSMSPSIVLKDGKPYMAVGSPGGSRIIGYTATAIIAHLDWGMNMQEAFDLPHAVNRFGTYDLEENTDAVKLQPALEEMGYKVNVRNLNSGLHGFVITADGLEGGADPRRDGKVMGQ